jgi:hypothetical protein
MPVIDIKQRFVSLERSGETHVWFTERLWKLSQGLPVFEYEIASFKVFDEDVWFGDQHKPTIKKILEHYKRIETASFDFPIVLSQDGTLFDGIHRVCRAYLEGRKSIPAVQFEIDPEPDSRIPLKNPI